MESRSYMREMSSDSWLSRLDAMGRSDSGVLVFESRARSVGSLLFERGRVCWAVGVERSLRPFVDKLEARTQLSRSSLLAVLARCRRERLPIWETLLVEKALSDALLREAVKEQCVEVCLQIEEARPTSRRWLDRPALGSRYGIPLLELVSDLAGRRAPSLTQEVDKHLDELRARGVCAMAYIDGLPRCPKRFDLNWPELVELYRWAHEQLRVSRRFSEGSAVISQSDQGFVLIAPRGRVLYVAMGELRQLGLIVHALPDRHGESLESELEADQTN